MRSHEKASSAGSTRRQATGQGRCFRGVAAIRGVPRDVDGSGAPSHRSRSIVFALAIAALAILVFAPLSQAKVVVNGLGPSSNLGGTSANFGGQFAYPFPPESPVSRPRGIAINNSGNGGVAKGTFYVVDGKGNRVQRFSSTGVFERAWGQNVLGRDERQQITIPGSPTGTFTFSFDPDGSGPLAVQTTNPITAIPGASTVQSALEALPAIGVGNVTVPDQNPGLYNIRFVGALGGTDVAQLIADTSGLSGNPATVSISTVENGSGGSSAGFEICVVAASCKEGLAVDTVANGGQLQAPQGVAVSQTTGHVYVTEDGNRRVSEFDADGNFVRAWGWDVIGAGKPNDSGTGFEICDTTAGSVATDCKQGVGGSGTGQFGQAANSPLGYLTIDASGNVWVADANNDRIQEFDSGGHFIRMVGGDVVSDAASGTGTLNGTTAVSAVVTSSGAFRVGQTISSGSDIPAGTTIAAVGANSITLSQAATGSGALKPLTVAAGAGNVPTNEQQTVTLGGSPTGGSFTLTFTTPNPSSTTATATAIPYNASAAALQTKLEGLSNLGAGNVSVSGPDGGPWVVTFQGARFADTDVTQLSADASGLISAEGKTVTVTSANALETCSVAADCRAGASGAGAGQFASSTSPAVGGPTQIAFDSGGNLYAIDPVNKRVQRFNPALTSASTFGASTLSTYTATAPGAILATQGGTRLVFAVTNDVIGGSGERQILELDPTDASVKDTSLVGVGLMASAGIGGLAADSTTGSLYLTTPVPDPSRPTGETYATSPISGRNILVLTAAPGTASVTTIDSVTVKTDTTATLSGSVDLKGAWLTCTFQYSTDLTVWTDVPVPSCDSLNPNGGAQTISAAISGLKPNTHYFARLTVSRPLQANSTKSTGTQAFDTTSVPPTITNVGAVEIGDRSMRMVGTIDPRNSATGYVFQYGATPALGSSTAPVDIGAGTTPLIVSRVVPDLSPDTTYYFRLVATNLSGTTNSSSQTARTRATSLPSPDERGFEMVSPPDKNFAGVLGSTQPLASVAEDGQAVAFCTDATFDDSLLGKSCIDYLSRRTADGWQTKAAYPPFCPRNLAGKNETNTFSAVRALSPNLDVTVFGRPELASCSAYPPLDPAAPTPGANLYRKDLSGDTSTYNLLTPALAAAPTPSYAASSGSYEAGSDDLGHIVFTSTGSQTPDTPVQPAGCLTLGLSCRVNVFEWDHGTLRLVSRKPDNTPFTSTSSLGQGSRDGLNWVSASGNRIFFQNGAGNNSELYMRENGTTTYDVSASECTSSCGSSAPDSFEEAAPSGARVLFRSAAKLTDDDPTASGLQDLYRYTHSATPTVDKNLTLLSRDNESLDGSDADVLGVIGESEDGTVVYFAANGQIVAGQPTGIGPKIYRWDWNGGSPTIKYLLTLSPPASSSDDNETSWDEGEAGSAAGQPARRTVSPSGNDLLVETARALIPAADSDGTIDVYRWDVQSGLACISCQVPGVPSAGVSSAKGERLIPASAVEMANNPRAITRVAAPSANLGISMSDDGKKIFFNTSDALVSQDTNDIRDVYEWNDGVISLVSSGAGSALSVLIAASRSGNDVFFYTQQRLVGWDVDEATDIYDARVGGGLPEPPAEGASCDVNAGACESAGSNAPEASGAGTATFQGPGNSTTTPSKQRCPKGRHKVRRNGKSRCVAKHQSQHRAANHKRRAGR